VNRRVLLYLTAALGLALVGYLSWWRIGEANRNPEPVYLNHDPKVKCVGSEACRDCHAGIYQSFMQTGMGQSFGLANPAKSSIKWPVEAIYDTLSGYYYQPKWVGQDLFLYEYRLAHADTSYRRMEKVDYIVGSGQHTNSHIQDRNGYLYQMPFTYYTQRGLMGLPPGFEGGHNSRYARALGMECISCHNDLPSHVPGSFNKFENVPLGIGCERCHGPGQAHVEAKLRGEWVDTDKGPDATIVNPAKLPYKLQTDVCQRCHLQGNALLKPGKDWADFRPGMALSQVMDIYMPVLAQAKGSFVMASHPHRLKMSQCFKGQGLTCITCHDPHKGVTQTKGAHYDAACATCHGSKPKKCSHSLGQANCVGCHMKKSHTVDIPHVSVTDHYIRIYEEGEAASNEKQGFTGLQCLTSAAPGPESKARAYLNFYEKFEARPVFLDSARHYLAGLPQPEHPQVWIHYHFLRADHRALVGIAAGADQKDFEPHDYYRIATAHRALGQVSGAVIYMEKALNLMPLHHEYRVQLAQDMMVLGRLEEARGHLLMVLAELPLHEEAMNAMGFGYLLVNDLDAAEDWFHKVLAQDPLHEQAMTNLAKVALGRDRLDQANNWLLRVLEAHPDAANARILWDRINAKKTK
jgi:hypothetical protein